MQVMISIDGQITHLADHERWALRQACAIEQHNCLARRDNLKTPHLKNTEMDKALFLEKLYKSLSSPLPPIGEHHVTPD